MEYYAENFPFLDATELHLQKMSAIITDIVIYPGKRMKKGIEKEATALLSHKSLRKTEPRLLILSALLNAAEPLSQKQIARQIRGHGVNKTTIYRTLSSLVTADVVHEAVIRNRIQYYETASHCKTHSCHPHFICRHCQKTICLTQVHIPSVSLPKGFSRQRQQIRIEGLCSSCNSG
jgi:Fur family ferric uptake transcriptional regulator